MILLLLLGILGRAIYEKGEGASPIVARISGGSEVPASALPCIGCHGADGRGKTEGGVTPSDIRNAELTKPYEVTAANGRRRAPYTDALLRRAITMGVDSSGHHFDPLMPRFQMTRADLDALVAYLHTLGTSSAPGVDEKTIRIATDVPPDVRAAIAAKIAELNAAGGIFGRRLVVVSPSEKPFVIIGDAALSLFGTNSVRQLAPGAVEQARALARATRDAKRIAIVGAAAQPEAAQAFRDATAAEIVDDRADTVLYLRTPTTLAPNARLLFLASTVPQSLTGFASTVAFSIPRRFTSRGVALAAVDVIAEAARTAGRELTQSAFLDAIDHMRGFITRYTPPLTWSSTRRIGWTTITVITFAPDGKVLDERAIDGE